MGVSGQSSASLDTFAGHAEHVFSVADGTAPLPAVEAVSSSWQRSATKYGLDPVDNKPPRLLTSGELKDFREPLDELIFSAQEDIDQLYTVVREAGYVVLFCDSSGVAVDHRGENTRTCAFEYWGTWLGGCGPRRWRARTASARASSKSDQSLSTEVSTLDRAT